MRTSTTPPAALATSSTARVAGGLLAAAALLATTASCSHGLSQGDRLGRVKREFLYSAGALAVGGTIDKIHGKRPAEPLLVQAATLLPPAGGHGEGRIGGFAYGPVDVPGATHVIRIAAAETKAMGTHEGGCYTTTVVNRISGLDVLGRLKAGKIDMQLVSRHCLDNGRETSFRMLAADFTDLTIDGIAIKTKRIASFSGEQTLSDLIANHMAGRERLLDRSGAPVSFASALPPRGRDAAGRSVFEDRLLMTSIFETVGQEELPTLERANPYPKEGHYALLPGNGIHVPDLGNVYFGRCLINRDKRETTMLHLELGSPVSGAIDIGDEYGNGHDYP